MLKLLENFPTVIHPDHTIELEDLTFITTKWIHRIQVTTDNKNNPYLFYFISNGEHPSIKNILDKLIPKYRSAHVKRILGDSSVRGISIIKSKQVAIHQVYIAKEKQ